MGLYALHNPSGTKPREIPHNLSSRGRKMQIICPPSPALGKKFSFLFPDSFKKGSQRVPGDSRSVLPWEGGPGARFCLFRNEFPSLLQ